PQYISVKMDVDFPLNGGATAFKVVILHPLKSEKYFPGSPIGLVNSGPADANVPEEARQHYERGVEFHRQGRLQEALAAYSRSSRAYPAYVPPLIDAGIIYLLLDRPQAGLTLLGQAVDIVPRNPFVRLNMAAGLITGGDYDGAIKILRPVIRD